MSDANIASWPLCLQTAIDDVNSFSHPISAQIAVEIEPEHKLGNLCDYLYFAEGKLQFHDREIGNMTFDFAEIYAYHQRQNYALSREPLAKALGIKGETKPIIWDTTCGTGKDTLLIHYFGGVLKSFERHPAIYLLLMDAKRRFPLDFDLLFADASQISSSSMGHGNNEDRPDVIYYDPMYPDKTGSKKSALPRKEMRIFKEMVGDDLDSQEFLEWALQTARSRVVVKRALSAAPLKNNPTASYAGKSTRYDMYKIF